MACALPWPACTASAPAAREPTLTTRFRSFRWARNISYGSRYGRLHFSFILFNHHNQPERLKHAFGLRLEKTAKPDAHSNDVYIAAKLLPVVMN
jgi:hypothetical protein